MCSRIGGDETNENSRDKDLQGGYMTYRPSTLWIVVIAVYAKDRNGNIEIGVLVVDSWEAEGCDY